MQASDGQMMWHAALAACLTLMFAAAVAAQPPPPLIAPAPQGPEFFSRYDFHLSAEALAIDDQRFSWDTHFGGALDLVDYVVGRTSLAIDYQAMLGNEFRAFDPNQGNYLLEAASSVRIGDTEVAGVFHHMSRHLSDRPKRFAIAWNTLGARILHRASVGSATVDVDVEGGRVVQHSYVDYTWVGEVNLLIRRSLGARTGVFARGFGQLIGIDETVAKRGTQAGGLVEAGVRINGRGGALELFGGIEQRVDAEPVKFESRHWALAGFRLLSR
jgi:hypothetical protein